jgi:hypothetical protein
MPNVNGTALTLENPWRAIIPANSSGGGKVPTEAGRYDYALLCFETRRPTIGSRYLKYQA